MEEFGWILLIAVFWVLSSIGEYRKTQQKKRRREEGGEGGEGGARPEPRRRERVARETPTRTRTGPRAGSRDLARDVDEGARQAEEALRRWEARQRASAEPALAGRTPQGPPAGAGRPSVGEDRREAYAAIAEMLTGRRPEPPVTRESPQTTEIPAAAEAPDAPEWERPVRRPIAPAMADPRPLGASRTGLSASRSRRPPGAGGRPSSRAALDRLGPLQKAVVWSEILGPPVSLRDQERDQGVFGP